MPICSTRAHSWAFAEFLGSVRNFFNFATAQVPGFVEPPQTPVPGSLPGSGAGEPLPLLPSGAPPYRPGLLLACTPPLGRASRSGMSLPSCPSSLKKGETEETPAATARTTNN